MKSTITIKPYLLKRRQKADGTFPIYIRIAQRGKYSLVSTGIAVDEKHWNPAKGNIRRNHARQKALNAQLQTMVTTAQQAAADAGESATIETAKAALSGDAPAQADFFSYADTFLKKMQADGRFWEWKQTKVLLRKFRRFADSDTFALADISTATLNDFKAFLIHDVGNGNRTVNKQFQRLERIIKAALSEGAISVNPFHGFSRMKESKSNKTRLSYQQIQAIEALELQSGWPAVTRDAFLFSFYNAGIRFGDVARLQWKHIVDGRLKYNMAKTSTGKNIKLLPPALAILNKYRPAESNPEGFIFPILKPGRDYSDAMYLKKQISSKNVMANTHLKKIAAAAGIQEHISFHVSRHSFADYARTSGMNIYDISKALGHSDIQITQGYLKSFDETSLDSSMQELFK
jgi:integrase